jgi:DNA repair exonuclease SbcCD ATPase subunit
LRSEAQRHKGSTDDTSGELASTSAELNDARRLVQSLRSEVNVLQRVNGELDTAKTEAYDKNDELAAALEEAQTQLLRLRSQLVDKEGESSAARAEAVEAKTAVADETRTLQDALNSAAAAKDEASQRVSEQQATIAQLQREVKRVKSETRVAQLEEELSRAQSAVVGAGEENAELQEQLARAEETIGDLVDKVQSVDELQQEAAAAARADERARLASQVRGMEGIHAELEAERTRYKEMQAQLAEEQVKAEDLRFRNEQYERGYGMGDLVGELDALRAENTKMAADLGAAGEELRERTDTVYTLTEIGRRLARDTGKYPDDVNVFTIYDTGDLVAQHASLVEQAMPLAAEA